LQVFLDKIREFSYDFTVILLTNQSMKPKPTKKEVVAAFRTREILAAAREVMERQGVETATMDEIAQAAGVAKGTLYLYFVSKEDLIHALMSQVGENMRRDLTAIVDTPLSPVEKLLKVVRLLLDNLERERLLFPLYMRDLVQWSQKGGQAQFPRVKTLEEEIVGILTRLFSEGIARGQFIDADPKLLTFLLRGLVRAVGYYQMTAREDDAFREVLPVVSTMILSGIARQAALADEVNPE
jgi:AcrR family transcriptional regulator